MWSAMSISWKEGGKRRTNLNTHYEKLFFVKSSDPDSYEIEKEKSSDCFDQSICDA